MSWESNCKLRYCWQKKRRNLIEELTSRYCISDSKEIGFDRDILTHGKFTNVEFCCQYHIFIWKNLLLSSEFQLFCEDFMIFNVILPGMFFS